MGVTAVSYYLAKPLRSSQVIYVPEGSIANLVLHLQNNRFDCSSLDVFMLSLLGHPQQGWIDIKKTELTKGDFLHALTVSKAALQEIVLIPGETLPFFLQHLAKTLALDAARLQAAYDRYAPLPDGVIIPETYHVPIGISEEHLMYYLVNTSLKTHRSLSTKLLGRYDETQWFTYVTVASIIQKEAADEAEMPLVSSVIYNRLKRNMRLQMDGTLNYGIYSHTKVTPHRIKNNSSPFNTYKRAGLPPSPVSSASLGAIKAAVFPAKSDYLYFVKSQNGRHTFSKSYNSHLEQIKSGKK